MGYYDYEGDAPIVIEEPPLLDRVFVYATRTAGVLLLLIGLVVGIKVVLEVFELYREPANIEAFAWAVAKGSNLDQLFLASGTEIPEGQVSSGFRMSYFLAWAIVLFLLLIAGRLAMAAVKTGGELAMHDAQLKAFARTLLGESLRGRVRPEPRAERPASRPVKARQDVRPLASAARRQR